ncbi:MtrB/PioB family outer membrane beta-barrel protein [Thiobaca trueperi]|uniref:Putative beta-barrel porin MtrB/PioB n=1 Tax=Thiobaca trueperi TaxID=127458 RepID=A0A4R3N4J4_9GAMM|nr:MtrB/PioB family outer membrane beta-barrel protein [Thiobaca trueperi]TCT22013.1 putative beta-barrel porin MtrB/PioB [Thiobaca trueperi]
MKSPWRKKTLTLCVSAALAQMTAGAARADSAVGVDTMLGNALNPYSLRTIPARDPEVLDAVQHQRTPSTKLIGWPVVVPTTTTTDSGWTYFGALELGGMWASGERAWYNLYKDLPTAGLYLNNFYFKARDMQPGKGYFVEGLGGALGYRDQYSGINVGRYNDWKVKLFYNEIPHTFTTNYRSLWDGVGSDYLTLKTLTPGGTLVQNPNGTPNQAASTDATRTNLLNAINAGEGGRDLELVRRKGGISLDKYLSNTWRFYGNYTQEKREGARPFGAVFGGGGGGGNIEIPESIDYDTHNILGALRYDDGLNNLNLQAQVSLFRNNIDTMTFENPIYALTNTVLTSPTGTAATAVTPGSMFTTGRYDLYPDNDYYNLRAEYGRSLPEWFRSRLTATISLSKMKQDDDLIAPTTNDMSGMFINGVSAYNNWNTTSALSKQSADAEIDTQLFDIGLTSRPLDKLDVNGKIRYYATDNKTDYQACNPLTGQWGRLINDGSGGAFVIPNATAGNNPLGTLPTAYDTTGCNLDAARALGLVPSAGNTNLTNIPYQYSKTNYELGGIYRLARGQSINGRIEREEYHRDYRERDETWENMVKVGYVNQAMDIGTLRASVEYGRRRGDSYDTDPYKQFYSISLGPEPTANLTNIASWIHNIGSFRKFDLADRDRLALDVRLDLITLHDLDLGISGQYRDMDYPDSDFGRNDHQKLGSATLDLNWQPSPKLGLYGYYTYQQSTMNQAGIQPNGCIIGNYYYFYSDGFVGTGTVPAAPARAGATVVNTVVVASNNWESQCGDNSATSPLWPDGRIWKTDTRDTNHAFGLGGRYDFGFARLELDYTYVKGISSIDYDYNSAALTAVPTAITAATWQLAGNGMPDMDYNQQALNFNLVVPLSKSVALRAIYRYEQGQMDDWHYAGVTDNPVPSVNTVTAGVPAAVANAVYLDGGTQDYHNNMIGLMVQVSF